MTNETREVLHKLEKATVDIILRLFGICFGAVLVAISYNVLILPHNLLTGGVSGLAFIGKYVFNIPIYLGIFILNIPIFFLGLKELDKKFIIFSLVGTLVMIIAIPLTRFIPIPELDIFLASVFSGLVNGLGIGIILRFGASTGGYDILSVIMKKRADIPVGTFSFYGNLVILLISLLIFELDITLYSFISIWVAGKVMNYVLEGINRKKSIMIISENNQLIAESIMKELNRGVTYLNGAGGFTHNNTLIINTVVNNYENAKIREIVQRIDPCAFMYITEAIEVSGRGFTLSRGTVQK